MKFRDFCNNLRMANTDVANVRTRYERIRGCLNREFWGGEGYHTLYVGSYGRGTAIHLSDIDIIYEIPYSTYCQYDGYFGNGQSALLQKVKETLHLTYPFTRMKGDGQVVDVDFSDGIRFEIVPGYRQWDGSYLYPDTHNGGSWKKTNPMPEIDMVKSLNRDTNKNMQHLCRMVRAWKDEHCVPMSGLLIDTFAGKFLRNWYHKGKSYLYYDYMTRDFFDFLRKEDDRKAYWYAIGSNQFVYNRGSFHQKAENAYNNAILAIQNEEKNNDWLANYFWRMIYGNKF